MTRRCDTQGDLPLIRWGEQLRRDKERARILRKRALAINFGLWLLIVTMAIPPTPRLIWNASASAPIGLYGVDPHGHVQVGDFVVAALPPAMRVLAARRHYLPLGVPLVKQVAAGPGDIACASGDHILINGRPLVARQKADAKGRALPWWQGCHILHADEYLLVMAAVPTSFDGRYFGITHGRDIIGRAHPLWTR